MNNEQLEEIKSLLNEFVAVRRKCKKSKSQKLKKQFDDLLQICASKLDFLVDSRTKRYKKFANYEDLKQDGRLALFLALQSYDPEKGDFFWWANKYIKTKISREANRHSTIKIPLKHTKYVQPYKVATIPIITDTAPTPVESINEVETSSLIRQAIDKLPEDQKNAIRLHFEFDTHRNETSSSVGKICEKLNISRPSCLKLLNDAKKTLKHELTSQFKE